LNLAFFLQKILFFSKKKIYFEMNSLVWKLKSLSTNHFQILDEEGKCTFLELVVHKPVSDKEQGLVTFSNTPSNDCFSDLWVPRTSMDSAFFDQLSHLFPQQYIVFFSPPTFFGLRNSMPEACFIRNPFLAPLFFDNMPIQTLEVALIQTFTEYAKYILYCFHSDTAMFSKAIGFDNLYGFGIFPSSGEQALVEKQYFIRSWKKRMEFISSLGALEFLQRKLKEMDGFSLPPTLVKLMTVLSLLKDFSKETEDTARACMRYFAELLQCYTGVHILDIFAKKSKKHEDKKRFKKKVVRFETNVKLF